MATISGTWFITGFTGAGLLPDQAVQFICNGVKYSNISTDSVTEIKVTATSLYYDDTLVGTVETNAAGVMGSPEFASVRYQYITFVGAQTVSSDFYNLFLTYATQISTDIYEPASAGGAYIGVSGKAKKVKSVYIGVDGKAKKIKKAYVGVGDKAQLWWSGGGATFSFQMFKPSASIYYSFTAEVGMTWAEWIESEYNIYSCSANSTGTTISGYIGTIAIAEPNPDYYLGDYSYAYVCSGDMIIKGATYVIFG